MHNHLLHIREHMCVCVCVGTRKNTISGGQVILQIMWILKLSPLWNIMPQALMFVQNLSSCSVDLEKKTPVASDFAEVPNFPVAEYCHEFLP